MNLNEVTYNGYPCKTVDDGGWKRIEVTFITDGKEA